MKLSRDAVKYLAVFAMTLNHAAHIWLQEGTAGYELLTNIGYFTAVTMCFFLTEGYHYTKSKKKYGQRLLIFGLISQFPYQAALQLPQANMLITLFLCYLLLVCLDSWPVSNRRTICCILLVFATCFCDWGGLAAIFTILFFLAGNSKKKLLAAFGIDYCLFSLSNLLIYAESQSFGQALLHGLLSGCGILASGIVLVFFYSGKRAVKGQTFSKWFFYLFYPLHLTVFFLLHQLL